MSSLKVIHHLEETECKQFKNIGQNDIILDISVKLFEYQCSLLRSLIGCAHSDRCKIRCKISNIKLFSFNDLFNTYSISIEVDSSRISTEN